MATMVEAFSQPLVARIVGLTQRQLTYLDQQGIVTPSIAPKGERGEPRLYSFQDLIRLRVVAEMRRRHKRPIDIRKTIDALEERGYRDPLVTVTFAATSDGNNVVYLAPGAVEPMGAHRDEIDQTVETFDLPLLDFRTGLLRSIAEMTARKTGNVTRMRTVQSNAPVIEGTRVPTATVYELAEAGWDTDRIIAAFPHLVAADVEAALRYERSRRRRRSA